VIRQAVDSEQGSDGDVIRCELVMAGDRTGVTVVRGVGCSPADAGVMCRLVAAGDPAVRDADPRVDARTALGPLVWLGDELPLIGDYADLVAAAERGESVGGRVRCEIELLPGGTVTVFRSPACTDELTGDLCGQVAGGSVRVRDMTPGARTTVGGRR